MPNPIYQTLAELPTTARIVQLEAVKGPAWRTIIWETEDHAMSVVNIFEHEDHVALVQITTAWLSGSERVWIAYKGGWFVEVPLSSNYDRTNARHLLAALFQAYATPEFKAASSEPTADKRAAPVDLKTAYELMRNPSKCSLAIRLECHKAILSQLQPRDKSQYLAEAVADLCCGVQMLLGDQAE